MVRLFIILLALHTSVFKGESHNISKSLLDETCGENILHDRIVGGKAAKLGQFPWIAMLLYKAENKMLVAACGGALINRRYVITAAHCLPTFSVRLGEYNTLTRIDCANRICAPLPQDIRVEKSIMHENFSTKHIQDDIGLLRLSRNANLNEFVKPICLPTQDIVDQEDVFQTTGWGYINSKTKNVPKILQTVSLTLFPLRACQKFYSAHDYTVSSNKQICAKGRNNRDTCDGDSGGPLMTVDDYGGFPRYYLVGIISFGTSECGIGYPGVYTRVFYYNDWILKNIKP